MLLLTVFGLVAILSNVHARYDVYNHEGGKLMSDGFEEYYPPYSETGYGGGGGGGLYEHGYMSDGNRNGWQTLHGNQPRCIDIPSNLTLCHGIGYDQMRLPNLLEHDTLQEVTRQAATWVNLLRIECHPDTRLFLCSLYSPVCLDRPIYPCRRLCEAVKSGCEHRMLKYGFPWPEMLQCDKFPLDNDLCISSQSESEESSTCKACQQPNTFAALVDNFCRAHTVLRVKLKREIDSNGEKKILVGKKKRIYKKGDMRKRDLDGMELTIANSQKCNCGLPGAGHEKDYYFAMGSKRGNKFYVDAMHVYDKNNRDMRKALRAIRKKDNICEKKGMEMLAINDDPFEEEIGGKKGKLISKSGRRPEHNPMTAEDQTTEAYIASTTAKIIAPTRKSKSLRRDRKQQGGSGSSRRRKNNKKASAERQRQNNRNRKLNSDEGQS